MGVPLHWHICFPAQWAVALGAGLGRANQQRQVHPRVPFSLRPLSGCPTLIPVLVKLDPFYSLSLVPCKGCRVTLLFQKWLFAKMIVQRYLRVVCVARRWHLNRLLKNSPRAAEVEECENLSVCEKWWTVQKERFSMSAVGCLLA